MIPSKQSIILAAIDCFSEKGYDLATLQDVADRAGVRTSCLSRNYAGKEALLADIMDYYDSTYKKYRVPAETILSAADDNPLSEVLPMLFRTFDTHEEYQTMVKIARIVAGMKCDNEPARKLLLRMQIDEQYDYLCSIFAKLVSTGRVRRFDYEALAFQMASFTHTLFEMLADGASLKHVTQTYEAGIAFFSQSMENMLLMDALHYAG